LNQLRIQNKTLGITTRYELQLVARRFLKGKFVGGDVDIVAQTTKLGEQVAGNTKLEKRSFVYLPP
jgi:hypothetical protein